jgi:hypothetical protein
MNADHTQERLERVRCSSVRTSKRLYSDALRVQRQRNDRVCVSMRNLKARENCKDTMSQHPSRCCHPAARARIDEPEQKTSEESKQCTIQTVNAI